jgi:CheY-like chemotaxis protein
VNGDAAARMIKSTSNINSKTPFILLTANAVEDLDPAVVGEFNCILTKPVSHANVIAVLKRTVDSS